MDLKDKLVLITGASSGIGRSSALQFAAEGAKLALLGRRESELERLLSELKQRGPGPFQFFSIDFREIEKIPNMVRTVELAFGCSVEVLVNCAGVSSLGFVEELELCIYQEDFLVNYFAPLALIQCVVPGMKRARQGRILSVSSGAATRGLPGVSAYCCSKGALHLLIESLRVELAPFGIFIISFSPGPVDTHFIRNQRVRGTIQEFFLPKTRPSSSDEIGRRLVTAIKQSRHRVELSKRGQIAKHLNYWVPLFLDRLLEKKMKRNIS